MKQRLLLITFLCLACVASYAQEVKVQGKVLDKTSSQPIGGVQVTQKSNPSNLTLTNDQGRFELTVPTGAVLLIHAVGYTDYELPVGNRTDFTVPLELSTANSLDEVVVVGAIIRKKDLTGAVSSLTAERIAVTPTTSINQAIQGRLPGAYVRSSAQPGANASIKIRGNNSIQFGTNPIFVVDGVIIDGGFNTLNPDDIASVDVLKDASATAIYGSRGANGVVVVTTKKGKSGVGKVTYNTWVGWQKFSRQMDLMDAADIFNLRVDAYANKYMQTNPSANRQDYINRYLLSDTSIAFAPYELASYRGGKSYDWLNEVVQTGVQQNHSLSFSGGTDRGNYFVSLNYTDQDGLIKNSNYKRYGGRVNVDQHVNSWLRIGTNTNFTRTDEDFADGSVFSVAVTANPLLPIDTAGLPYLKWAGILNQDAYNPLRSLYITDQNFANRIISSNYVSISPIKDLAVRSTLSIDFTDQKRYRYVPITTGQDKRNSYHGSAMHYNNETTNWQWDNTATYTRRLKEHTLSGLLGTSLVKNASAYDQINAYGFPNDDFGYMYLGGAYSRDKTSLSSDFVTTTMMSYLGRADYSFRSRYFLTATLRYDGSSKFGERNKWGAFPSVAAAYDMSQEAFMDHFAWINKVKWRAGYGIAGNQNIPNYAYKSLYRPNYTNNSVTYASDGRLGNPDLRWERQKQLNLGVDLAFLNRRLNVTADYFDITNDDLLMVRTLSTTTGFTNMVSNVGALSNKGVELNVDYAVLKGDALQWNLTANISSDKNKITKLYGSTTAIYNKGGATGVEIQRTGNLFLGESINSIYAYKFDRIAQASDIDKLAAYNFGGRTVSPGDIIPLDKDGNKIIDDNDRYVVGKLDPKFYGGFGTDATYKGFGLSAFFNYSYGAKRLSGFYEGMIGSSGLSAGHKDLLNRWTPTNTNTTIPRAVYGVARYNVWDVDLAVQDASFIRLSNLSLSYNVPEKASRTVFLSNARFYVTGSNLLLFTKDKGYDPETGDYYPNSKMVTVGLNITL